MNAKQSLNRYGVMIMAAASLWGAAAQAQEGAWPTAHRDAQRQGRAWLPGEIDQPAVSWSYNTGGRVQIGASMVADVNADGQEDFLFLVGGAVLARGLDNRLLWDTAPLEIGQLVGLEDLNGDGRPELIARGASFLVLDGATGRPLWSLEGLGDEPLGGSGVLVVQADQDPEPELLLVDVDAGAMALHDFSQGFLDTQRWSTRHQSYPTQVMMPVVGDFDGDGTAAEIAVINQEGCQAVFTDLRTGQVTRITEPLTDGVYCYGLTRAVNLDSDAQDELLFSGAQGYSEGSLSLTSYDYAQDRVQWQHQYGVNTSSASLRTPVEVVGDMNGDGTVEVAISTYNNTQELSGDDGVDAPGRWEVVVYEGATGALVDSLPNARLQAVQDVDADQIPELILERLPEGEQVRPRFYLQEVWELSLQGTLSQLWSQEDSYLLYQLALRPDAISRDVTGTPATVEVSPGRRHLLLMTRDPEGRRFLHRVDLGGPAPSLVSQVQVEEGLEVFALGLRPGQERSLFVSTNLGQMRVYDDQMQLRDTVQFSGYTAPVLATDRYLLYRDSSRALVAQVPGQSEPAWVRTVESNGSEFLAMDMQGDGSFEVIQVAERLSGEAYLELLDEDGALLWSLDMEGAPPLPNSIVGAQLGGDDTLDLAFFFRQPNLDFEVVGVDGATGQVLGRHFSDPEVIRSSANRQLFPLLGDQLLVLHNIVYEILDGGTLTRQGAAQPLPSSTSNAPRSTLFQGPQGENLLFLNLFTTRKALMNVDSGETLWAVDEEPSLLRYAAPYVGLADANGDAALDFAVPGRFGDITVFDGLTGAVIRRICVKGGRAALLLEPADGVNCQAAATLSSVAVGDINGDGALEYVLGSSAGWLYALDVATGQRLWSLSLRYAVGSPILTDYDNDGMIEVVAPTADSRIVGVDQQSVEPTAEVREVNLAPGDLILAPEVDVDLSLRTDALGAAWDAVEDAQSYQVTLLSQNLNPLQDPVVVQGTEHVFTGLSLLPGAFYFVEVVALGAEGNSRPTLSDGVLVAQERPMISGLQARPDRFDPARGQSTTITGRVIAAAGLRSVSLEIRPLLDEQAPAVVQEVFDPLGALDYNLEFTWDGGGQPLGTYEVRALAYDSEGAGVYDVVLVSLEEQAVVQPDAGMDSGADQGSDLEPDASGDDMSEGPDLGEGDMSQPDEPDADTDAGADLGVEPDPEPEVIYIYRDRDGGCCGCTTTPGRLTDLLGPLALLGLLGLLQIRRRQV